MGMNDNLIPCDKETRIKNNHIIHTICIICSLKQGKDTICVIALSLHQGHYK